MLFSLRAETVAALILTLWLFARLSSLESRLYAPHTIFLYSAVYDDRSPIHRVRILGYSRCFGAETSLQIEIGGNRSSLSSAEVIAWSWGCPEIWAGGFDYQEFEFVSEPLRERPSEITFIVNSDRKVTMPVRSRNAEKDETLEMCVVPLFWYADWPRMLTWIEHWRRHHKASFVIYKHTVSKNVEKLLQYYQEKGVVKIVPWPRMPIAGTDDLRTQLYRIGNKVAANDCISRVSNKFAAWLDVDEYVGLSNNQTLLDFARDKFKLNDGWGSLSFEHFALTIPPIDETFAFVESSQIHTADGPPKVLFMPSRAHQLQAHKVDKYIGNYHEMKLDSEEAKLLHMRMRFPRRIERTSLAKYSEFTPNFRQQLSRIAHEIYGPELPHVNLKALLRANDICLSRSRNMRTDKGPATPYQPETCTELMLPLDDWVFAQSTEDSRYYFV